MRSQLRRIQEKYKKKQDHVIATKDRHLLKKLREDEKMLSQKQIRITTELQKKQQKEETQAVWRYISILLRCLTPFRVIIGVSCLTVSCVIQGSVLITSAERLLRSGCAFKCGHLLEVHKYFNPLDSTLVHLSSVLGKVFGIRLHVDDFIVLVLLCYLYVCTFFGIVKLGVSESCLSFWNTKRTSYSYLFRIRKRGSFPQALTVGAGFLMLIMFNWYQSLALYLPNYFTFVH